MRHTFMVLLTAALVTMPPRDVTAQSYPATDPLCFRGRPLPRCDWFTVLEATLTGTIATTRTLPAVAWDGRYPDFTNRLDFGIGFMKNAGTRRARGVVLNYSPPLFNEAASSLEWRERFWLGGGWTAADASLGYAWKNVYVRDSAAPVTGRDVQARGLAATAAVTLADVVGVTARGDMLFTPGRTHRGVALGVRAGSYGTVTVAVLYVAAIALLLSAMGD
jgi:hypothetical protein